MNDSMPAQTLLVPAASDITALRDAYRERKASLLASVDGRKASARGVQATLRRMSRITDEMLRELWSRAALPDHTALLAVGG
jgi:[protein-PII] uridylyltransferase